MEGDKKLAQCADGLIFDVTRGSCFFKEQSICIVDVAPETTTTEQPQITDQTLLPSWFEWYDWNKNNICINKEDLLTWKNVLEYPLKVGFITGKLS